MHARGRVGTMKNRVTSMRFATWLLLWHCLMRNLNAENDTQPPVDDKLSVEYIDPEPDYKHTTLGDDLVSAARDGNLKHLLELMSDTNTNNDESIEIISYHRSNGGISALMAACATGSSDIVDWILSEKMRNHRRTGASPSAAIHVAEETPDDKGNSPLLWAVRYGYPDFVRVLLRHGASVNRKDVDGWNPLSTAVHEGHVEIVQTLVDHGCDVDATENEGYTALMWAAEEGHEEIIRILLAAGARIDAVNSRGGSSLMWAAYEKKPGAVKLLLDSGADPNLQDESGFSALHIAVGQGAASCVTHLLAKQYNTNVDVRETNGVTPLMGAVRRRHLRLTEQLISAGAALDLQEPTTGFTPLMRAIQSGQRDIALRLIEAGADVDVKGLEGNTALMSAAQEGETSVINALLRHGAKINDSDSTNGFTSLMSAAYFGHQKAVEALLGHEADCTRRSSDGLLALDYAVDEGHQAIATLLKSKCNANTADAKKTPREESAEL